MTTNITYVDHTTGEVYENHAQAMDAYRNGHRIDLYDYSEALGEWVLRGFWEV